MHLPYARISLALTPTPLQRLERLSTHTGVEFFIKRDDLTGGMGLSGNKVRKLEYLMAEAMAMNATHILTTGGPQSNHARATAAAAARLGLPCILILAGRDPGSRQGNLLLDALMGAEIRFPLAISPDDQARCLADAAAELTAAGGRPYVVPIGGSTPLGTLGSYQCYREIAEYLDDGAWICFASGSGGTHAGLALGTALHGKTVRVQGFSVWLESERIAPITTALIAETARLLEVEVAPPVMVDDAYLAPRYGKESAACLEAIRLLASLEGIILDHVYTGKAMAGVLDYIRRGIIRQGERVLFVHTGGAPALFTVAELQRPSGANPT